MLRHESALLPAKWHNSGTATWKQNAVVIVEEI